MSLFHENIKQILADVEQFLVETLKKETKLGKKTVEHKQQILDKLTKFFAENPSMKGTVTQEGSSGKDLFDESLSTGGSSRSDDSQDPVYNEAGISVVAATDLESPVFSGFLEKKQKKGSGLFGSTKFQSRWCVLQGGIFYYFIKQDDKKQAGSFKIDGYKFRNAPDIAPKKNQKELCFEFYQDDDTKRIYQFMAKTKEEYDKWHDFIDGGGSPLIEEDIYEICGEELSQPVSSPAVKKPSLSIPVPVVPVAPAPDIEEDVYEETDDLPPPPAPERPPPSTQLNLPPPPPPIATSPGMKHKMPVPEPIADDIYDDGFSAATTTNNEPPPVGPVPQIPKATRKQLATRNLPELPPLPKSPEPEPPTPPKKRLKISITCKPEEDYENKYYGIWDCEGENTNELTFKKGDIIHILSKEFDEKSWWVGELDGNFGLVPKEYMVPAYVLLA